MSMKTVKAAKLAAETYTEAGVGNSAVVLASKPSRFKTENEITPFVAVGVVVPWSKEYFARLDAQVEFDQVDRRKSVPVVLMPINTKKVMSDVMAEVDEIVDIVFKNAVAPKVSVPKFDIHGMLKDCPTLTLENVDHIKNFYIKQRQEVQGALDGTDVDLVDGYKFLKTPAHKRKVIEFYDSIEAGCDAFLNLKIRRKALARKVRVPKPVAASKQVKALKFMQESDVYNVVSVQPELVIGAQSLFVFNTGNKKLTHFIAADRGGFKVKGTTLLNYDEKLSVTKSLRKPNITLKGLIGATKPQMKKIMDSLTTKPSVTNGRINLKTVLVRVDK